LAGTSITGTSGASITTQAQPLTLTADVANSGTGAISLTSDTLATNGGNLTISAPNAGTATALTLSGDTISVGAGTGTISGTAPTAGGIQFSGTSTLTDAGAGSLALTGTHSGSGAIDGIEFLTGATVTSSGTVTLSGSGGGSTNSNGVHFAGTSGLVDSSGNLTVTGVVTSGGSGVWFNGVTTLTNSGSGAFSVSGSNSNATGFGIALGNATQSLTTSGPISLSGTESSSGYGIKFVNTNTITDSSGNLTMTGTSASGEGVQFATSNTLSNSGTGSFTVTGTSSSGVGTQMNSATTLTDSITGTLSVSGTSSGSADGLQLAAYATVSTTRPVSLSGSSSSGTGIDFLGSNTVTDHANGLTTSGTSTSGSGVSFSGAITLANSGTGSFAVTGTSASGVGTQMTGATTLTNSSSGALSVSGTSSGSVDGLQLAASATESSTGPVSLSGSSSSGTGIDFLGSSTVTDNSGAFTLNGNSMTFAGTIIGTSSGTLTIQPITASTSIGIGASQSGTLNLTAASLATIQPGFASITIGSPTGTGAIDVGAWTANAPLTIQSPAGAGSITLNGALATGSSTSAGSITLLAGTSITGTSGASITTQAQPLTLTADVANSGTGAISLTSDTITTNGGNLTISAPNAGTATALTLSGDTISVGAGTGTISGTSSGGNGVAFSGSSSLTAGSGSALSVSGTTTVSTGFAGVQMLSNANVTTAGSVTLSGTCGSCAGMNFYGSNALTASSGTLTVNGTSTSNNGVLISGTDTVTNSSTATLSITGTSSSYRAVEFRGSLTVTGNTSISGSAGSSGTGTFFDSTATSTVTSGNVSITGSETAGVATRFAGTTVTNSGSGNVSISGTSNSNQGFLFTNANTVSNTGGGTLTLSGTSGSNFGLEMSSASLTASGNLSMSGTSTSSLGVELLGSTLTTSSGNTALSGSSGSNAGIYFSGSDSINNNGAGSLVMSATSASYRAWELATGASLATAGNMTANATTSTGTGVYMDGSDTLSVSSGTLSLYGTATTSGLGADLLNSDTLTNSGSGALNISGTSNSGIGMKAVGNASLTTSGSVTLSGTSNSGNGLFIQGANSLTVSSGTLTLSGNSTSAAGVDIQGANTLNNGGSAIAITGTSGSGNGVQLESGVSVATTGNLSVTGASGSGYGINLSAGDSITASSGNLTLSGASSSSFGQELMAAGSITNNGTGTLTLSTSGGIDLNASITSTSGPAVITGSGNITQSAGTVAVSNLLLSGTSGNFTLNASGNQLGTLAANAASATVNDQSALTIGSVLGTAGVTTSAGVTLTTASNLTIASGAPVSGASPVLAAIGAFINDAGSGAVTATSGNWLIYSSSPSSDTFASLNSGNTALWNATYTSLPPSSVTAAGNFYLFAFQPTLTLTSTSASKTYGTNDTSSVAGNYTASGYQSGVANAFLGDTAANVFGGTPSVTSTGSTPTATVSGGPYAITIGQGSVTSLDSYALSFQSSGVLTVNPATLTVTASNQSTVYGTTFALGTTAFTDSGLVNSDTLTAVTLASPGTVATATVAGGPYAITPTNATGTGLSNYTLSFVNGALTVNPTTLTVTASNQSKTYGTTLGLGTTAFTDTGLVNSDTLTGVTLTSPGTIATATVAGGPYTITPTNATGTGLSNYTLSFVNGALTVNPTTLTVTASNQSKTYGTTLALGTSAFTDSGLVNSDTLSAVTLASPGTVATATVVGGPYAITPSNGVGTGLSNYSISYANGALTVNPATLTVTASNQSKVYGTTLDLGTTAFTDTGLVNSDTLTAVTLASPGSVATSTVAGGPYAITPSNGVGTGLSNYSISYVNGALAVNPATLTVTASNQSKTYGTTLDLGSSAFADTGLLNSDTLSAVTLASPGAVATSTVAGGPYAITPSNATGSGLSNYTLSYVNGVLAVNPATLTVTASNQSKVYGTTLDLGGTAFTDSGLMNSDTLTAVTLASPGTVATSTVAGGPYAITPSNGVGTGLSNYTLSYVNGALAVNPATLTVTASNQSKVYGSTLDLGSTAFTDTDLVNSDTLTAVTLASPGSVATSTVAGGPYAITPSNATGSGLSNYTLSYVNGALTVNPATLTVTASNQSKTYGTTLALGTTAFTDSGLLNSDTLTAVTLASPGTAATSTVAGGPYAITPSNATGSGLSNYTLSYMNGALTVNPATLTVTASNQSKTYGTTLDLGTTAFTDTGLVNSDTLTAVTLASPGTVATSTVVGGPYAITPSNSVGTGLSNYTIGYVNGELAVNPATLTVTASNQSKTYGTTLDLGSTAFTETGLVNSDTLSAVTLASPGTVVTATVAGGPYAITPSNAVGSGLGNYSISYGNAALTVNPATLTVTASNQSKTYGVSADLGTTAYTEAGLITANGDAVSAVTLTSPGALSTATVAGAPYAITPSNAQGAGLANYTIDYVNAQLSVNQVSLTITPLNQAKTYGQLGNLGTTAFTEIGLVSANGDALAGVTLTSSGTPVTATVAGGPYPIYASNAQGSGLSNYQITYAEGALTVNPAGLTVSPLNITAANQSKVYGTTLDLGTTAFTAVGLLNSDTVSGVTLTSAGAAASATVLGGPYLIVPSNAQGSGLSNYTISYIDGVLTVLSAPLTVSASNQSKTYGSVSLLGNSAFSTSGLLNGDNVTSVSLSSPGSAIGATVTGGPYTITSSNAQGSGLSNYSINYVNGVLTVLAAPLTVTASNQSKNYGTSLDLGSTAFTDSGLLNSDSITGVTLSSPGTAVTATVAGGPYAITPSNALGSGLSNYTINYANGSLAVSPATLTVTASNQSKTYGAMLALGTTAFTDTGLANSDSITGVTLSSPGTIATATVAGGPYAVIPSSAVGTGLSNYTIDYVTGALIVNPATLTVTASNQSKVYGTTLDLGNAAFTETGLVNSDTLSAVALSSPGTVASTTVAGGPYAITPSSAVGTGLSNYAIDYANGALIVNPAALAVTASNQSKTYGTTLDLGTTAFTETGLVNSDTLSAVSLSSPGTIATATVAGGPYAITPSNAAGSGLSNYSISYTKGALTVNPASLTVTASNQSKTYGAALDLGSTAFTDTGLVNSDTLTGSTLASPGTVATATVAGGPYAITPSNAVGTGLSNYTLSYINGALTVNPATLTVTSSNQSKVYGTTLDLSGAAFTETGLVNSDVLSAVTLASPGTVATATVVGGPYAITPSNAVGSGLSNYTLSYTNGELIVNPATLTVIASNQSKTYGTTLDLGTTAFTEAGLVNSDTLTGVSLASPGTVATTTVAGGPYAITPGNAQGTGLSNYSISFVNGVLTVNPALLTGVVIAANKVYDGTTTATLTSETLSGAIYNADANHLKLTVGAANFNSADVLTADTVTATNLALSGSAASNYELNTSMATASASVTPRPLTISANPESQIYGNLTPIFAYAIGGLGLVSGDSLSGSPTAGTTQTSPVGSYWISPGAVTASANYAVTYVGNTLQIDPRALTIVANPESQLFGNPTPPLTYTVGGLGLVNGDHLAGALSTPTDANAAVGSYPITQGTLTASSDYALSYVGATLRVLSPGWPMSAELAARTYIDDQKLSAVSADFDATAGTAYVDRSAACMAAAHAAQAGPAAGVIDPTLALHAQSRCAGAWARAGETIDWWAIAAGRTAMAMPSSPKNASP